MIAAFSTTISHTLLLLNAQIHVIRPMRPFGNRMCLFGREKCHSWKIT